MKYKKGLIFICLVICLFSIASVVASEVNETVVASDDQIIEGNETITVEEQNVDEISTTDENELSVTTGSFTDLANDIAKVGNELNLTRDYIYSSSDSDYEQGVIINKKITINGNGFTINGNDQARAFKISASNVVLNNISFVNCLVSSSSISSDSSSEGGAIYWEGNNGVLVNCSFLNCYSSGSGSSYSYAFGGAVCWRGYYGVLSNCSFAGCSVSSRSVYEDSYAYGGAVCWRGYYGVLSNCSFVDCSVSSRSLCTYSYAYGGAVYWFSSYGVLANSSFADCSVSSSYGSNTNMIYSYGGAVYWEGNNGVLSNCSFLNCYSSSSSSGDSYVDSYAYAGAVYWEGNNGVLANCSFEDCSASARSSYVNSYARAGAVILANNGVLSNCSFMNCSASAKSIYKYSYAYGGTVYCNGVNGTLFNCSFVDCSSYSSISKDKYIYAYGGAVYSDYDGILSNCSFVKCHSSNGGAIYSKNSDVPICNSNFINNSASNIGGAIYIDGDNHIFTNCIFNGNSAKYDVSAIYIIGNSSFYNCSFNNNVGSGPAMYASGTSLFIENCVFLNNNFALDCYSDSLEIFKTNFTKNYGANFGAINCEAKKVRIDSCNFDENYIYERGRGGAFHAVYNQPTVNYLIINSNFTNNYATYNGDGGGAIYQGGSIKNCSFINNRVIGRDTQGGAIYKANLISDCYFINNTAQSGGAISRCNNIKNSVFLNNKYSKTINCDDCSNIANCSFNGDYYNYSLYIKTTNKISSNISINVSDFNAGDMIIISTNVVPTASGNITFIINNESYNISLVKDQAKLKLSPLMPGNYSVNVIYSGDDCYLSSIMTTTFKVIGLNSKLDLFFENSLIAGNNTIVNVTLNEDACGDLIFKIFDQEFFSKVNYGKSQINISNLKGGLHNFTLKYFGDYIYNPLFFTDFLNVEFKQSFIKVNFDYYMFGDTIILNPIIPPNATGNITLYIEDIFVQTVSYNNSFKLKGLNAGMYKLKLIFSGDDYYRYSEYLTNLTINPKFTSTHINVTNGVYGENVNVNVSASENGKITVKLGTIIKDVNVEANKIYSVDFGILDAKLYTVNATFNGGNNYEESYYDASLVISPAQSKITVIQPLNKIYGENVTVTVKTNVDGHLTVKIGDITKVVDVIANQIIPINFGVLDVNSYDITLNLNAGSNYISDNNSTKISVSPKQTYSTLTVKEYESTENVIINVTATENGQVTIKCGSIVKTVNVTANNVTPVNLGILPIGPYEVIANFTAGNNYNDSSDSAMFKVLSKINDKDISISIPDVKVGQVNNIAIKLPNDATGTVTLIIGNDNYSFDVTNGVANVRVPELAEGNHAYILSYSGDGKYSSYTKTGTLIVSKQTTPAKPVVKTILTLKTVKVKKSAKKLVLQATLKQGNNPLKSKKIIFKFNGKKYTTKTNKKGVAKVTIKKNVLKKLKVGKKVKYQANYGKIIAKKTVKVKK